MRERARKGVEQSGPAALRAQQPSSTVVPGRFPRPITGSLARIPRVSYIPSPCLSRSWDRAAAGQARSATTSSTLLPALACFRRFSACSLYVTATSNDFLCAPAEPSLLRDPHPPHCCATAAIPAGRAAERAPDARQPSQRYVERCSMASAVFSPNVAHAQCLIPPRARAQSRT